MDPITEITPTIIKYCIKLLRAKKCGGMANRWLRWCLIFGKKTVIFLLCSCSASKADQMGMHGSQGQAPKAHTSTLTSLPGNVQPMQKQAAQEPDDSMVAKARPLPVAKVHPVTCSSHQEQIRNKQCGAKPELQHASAQISTFTS